MRRTALLVIGLVASIGVFGSGPAHALAGACYQANSIG